MEQTKVIVQIPKSVKKEWLKALTDMEMTQKEFILKAIDSFLKKRGSHE